MNNEISYEGLGKRIRQQRKLAQMTQEILAEKAEISLSFLGHIERGTRKASLETLVKLCNVLKVSPQLLLQDSLEDDLLEPRTYMSGSHKQMIREISNLMQRYEDGIEPDFADQDFSFDDGPN